MESESNWVVYGLICKGDKTYIGITNNWERRFHQHSTGKGAKFTKTWRPVSGAVILENLTRSEALKNEYKLKGCSRLKKIALIKGGKYGIVLQEG